MYDDRLSGAFEQALNDGEAKGQGLAGAGLSDTDKVFALKGHRDCLFLNWRGNGVARPVKKRRNGRR